MSVEPDAESAASEQSERSRPAEAKLSARRDKAQNPPRPSPQASMAKLSLANPVPMSCAKSASFWFVPSPTLSLARRRNETARHFCRACGASRLCTSSGAMDAEIARKGMGSTVAPNRSARLHKPSLPASPSPTRRASSNQRNGPINAGANMSESNISRNPPIPAGINVAESFTPHSLFMQLSIKSPAVPINAAATPNASALPTP